MSSLKDIINKWVEITEVDPNSKVFYLYTYNNTTFNGITLNLIYCRCMWL